MKRILSILLCSLMLFAATLSTAWAISLEQAARQVAAQYQGRVISAQTVNRQGRKVHVIRVKTKDGRVKTVRIPAGS